jgi:hypothetical protein
MNIKHSKKFPCVFVWRAPYCTHECGGEMLHLLLKSESDLIATHRHKILPTLDK